MRAHPARSTTHAVARPAPTGAVTKFTTKKVSEADKAAMRANPHAAGLRAAGRGGLMQASTRQSSRITLPIKPTGQPASSIPGGGAIDGAVSRAKVELLNAIDEKVQQLLPGAASSKNIVAKLDEIVEGMKLSQEEATADREANEAQFALIVEAINGNKDAKAALRETIPAARADAKKD